MSQFERFGGRPESESVREFTFGPYRLRTDDLVLRCRGDAVALAPKVALTLLALLERAGEVVSKEDLLQAVWGGSAVEESNLSQNIYTLRRHFEANGDQSLIETLPRRGYRFTGRVRCSIPGDRTERARASRARSILAGAAAVAACGIALIIGGSDRDFAARIARSQTFAADQAYDTGWLYYRQGTSDGYRAAVRYFERATVLNPSSPLGDAGQAISDAQLADLDDGSPSGVSEAERAEWLTHHVLPQYTNSAEALAAKGYVEYDLDGDFVAAARDLQHAEYIDPKYAPAYLWYGNVLLWQGNVAPARMQLVRATRLDPTLPSTDYYLAWDYYFSRDFANAIAYARLAISDPWTSDEGRLLLAAADEEAGRYKPAIAAVAGLTPGPTDDVAASATRAHIYATMGDHIDAARELRTVERLTLQYRERPLLTAMAYLANGRFDETFAWLSRLSRYNRTILAMDPRLDRVRHDPRFAHWLHG